MNWTGWGRLLRLASGVLAVSALLVVAGQVAQALGFPPPGAGARARLELLSYIAESATGLLVVGAVMLALVASRMRDGAVTADGGTSWPLVLAGVLGVVIVMAAIYSVIDLVTLHIPSPGATGQTLQVALSG